MALRDLLHLLVAWPDAVPRVGPTGVQSRHRYETGESRVTQPFPHSGFAHPTM